MRITVQEQGSAKISGTNLWKQQTIEVAFCQGVLLVKKSGFLSATHGFLSSRKSRGSSDTCLWKRWQRRRDFAASTRLRSTELLRSLPGSNSVRRDIGCASPKANVIYGAPAVAINRDGDNVRMALRRGKIRALATTFGKTTDMGAIFIPFHGHEAVVNRLTTSALDAVAKILEHKVCSVKLEKVACQAKPG